MASSYSFPVSDGITQVTSLGLVLVSLFVSGRLASNLQMQRCLFLDDYVAVAGFALFITYSGLCFGIDAYARYDQSAGAWDPTAPFFLKTIYAAEVLAAPASLTVKTSMLLLYLRIFNPSVQLRHCVVVIAGVTGIFAIPSLPLFSFYCAPNATTTWWAPSLATTCASVNIWSAVLQVGGALINLALFILPLPSIYRLHLPLKRRLLLAFVLMHGIFALAASITGAVYRVQLAKTPADDPGTALRFRTAAFTAYGVELSMTLVTGSMHACWGFFRSLHARFRSSKGSSGATYYYDSERHGASGGSGEKMAAVSIEERESEPHPGQSLAQHPTGINDFRPTRTPPSTSEAARRWGIAFTSYSRTVTIPADDDGDDDDDDLMRPATAPNATTVLPAEEQPASKYPCSPSDSEASSGSRPASRPASRPGPTPNPSSAIELSNALDNFTYNAACDAEPQPPATTAHAPVTRGCKNLIADIEAAVATAGKACLVVGHTRQGSGVSYDAVDVRQSFDHSDAHMDAFYTSSAGSPVSRTVADTSEVRRPSTEPEPDQKREYVVEKVGADYLVLRPSNLGGKKKQMEPWMGIRRDVKVEVRESV